MIRMNHLKNNTIYETTKRKLYNRLNECLDKLRNSKKDEEGRIKCFDASMRIIVTGKEETVEEYLKFILRKFRECGVSITDKPSEMINTHSVVLFNLVGCDLEQKNTLMEYINRHRGISYVFLPYYNYSENIMGMFGDGYYLQLGTKPKVSNDDDF